MMQHPSIKLHTQLIDSNQVMVDILPGGVGGVGRPEGTTALVVVVVVGAAVVVAESGFP